MAWRGSLSRSISYASRASGIRSSGSLPRVHAPPLSTPRLRPRRISFSNPRTMGELGCVQSLLPLHNVVGVRLTSHLAVNVRACCELSHGMEKMGDVAAVSKHPGMHSGCRIIYPIWHINEVYDHTLFLNASLSCCLNRYLKHTGGSAQASALGDFRDVLQVYPGENSF